MIIRTIGRFLVERGMHAPPRRTRIGASSLRQDYGDQGCRSMGGNGAREAAVQRRPVAAPSTRQLLNVCLLDHLSPLPLVQRIPARPLSVSTVVKPSVRACMCALDTSWKCTRLCKVIERWRNIRFFYSVRFDVNEDIYIYIL